MEWAPVSQRIWDMKYRFKTAPGGGATATPDADLDATWWRVARALAVPERDPELWAGRFHEALSGFKFLPAGRVIAGAGTGRTVTLFNCFVMGTIPDDMSGIFENLREAALTMQQGGGIGHDFSSLRPQGAPVVGVGADASGPLSFMDVWDSMCRTIMSAGSRRGAMMATLRCDHPDIEAFIDAKRDPKRLRMFNVSVLVTDAFMKAVADDADWPLVFGGRTFRTVKAKGLWERIMRATYDVAEPGVIFIDRVNRRNNLRYCETIQATNPCVTAETWVHTAEGPRQVADLIGRPFTALVDGKAFASGDAGFFATATKEVRRLRTRAGHELRLTADHLVRKVTRLTRWSREVEWVAAGDLAPGDQIVLHDHREAPRWDGAHTEAEGYLLGLLVGDGTLKRDKAVLSVWKPAQVANGDPQTVGSDGVMEAALAAARTLPHRADFTGWMEVKGRNEWRLSLAAIKTLAETMDLSPGCKTVTPAMEKTSSDFHRGLLRGLFDSDGSVQGTQAKGVSIRLSQSDLPLLEAVQRMLLRLGIASKIYRDRGVAGTSLLPDGRGSQAEYPVQAQHELVISGDNLPVFAERIGFADTGKQDRLDRLLEGYVRNLNRERFVATVSEVVSDGVEDVYDVQVPGINTFDGNGFHAHNCGEQPLPPYGACLLGSVNLTTFVRDPFTAQARFDWEEYKEVVRVFTRMLDNVVEVNGLPLEQQRNEIMRKRRHGMGFLGLGSTVTMLQMKYGDKDSVAFTEQVSREMAVAGWEVALALGREKGPAPIMDEDFTVTAEMLRKRPEMKKDGWKAGQVIKGRVLHAKYSRYMQRVAEVAPELVKDLAEHGARFTHHSSIAPTGTISLSLANNASNGIEPSFAHHYSRNVIREGKKSKEKVEVFSYELLAYRTLVNPDAMPFGTDDRTRLPDYFISADDITPKAHVDIQAASQKWIDSSISKTANVPTDYPYEDFKDIYMYAHKQGLKGCTTFRFNPAAFQGVLVKEADLENTTYRFELEDGTVVEARGNEEIEYDGELHSAANLFDALKEGYYGKF